MKQFIITLLFAATSGIAVAGGDPVAGKSTAIICTGCHNADGNSTNTVYPKLAGQGEGYLAKQLADFKSGARKEDHMTSMVDAISGADIPNLAAFFSSQVRTKGTASKANTDLGKKIYQAGAKDKGVPACASCHGPKGLGSPAEKFPSLANQHSEYITKMLKEFRSGTRSNDPQKMMRNVATKLSDEEIESLSAYVLYLN